MSKSCEQGKKFTVEYHEGNQHVYPFLTVHLPKGAWPVMSDAKKVEALLNSSIVQVNQQLLTALKELFASYKALADSGDAGNWRIEDYEEGKKALQAIAAAEAETK